MRRALLAILRCNSSRGGFVAPPERHQDSGAFAISHLPGLHSNALAFPIALFPMSRLCSLLFLLAFLATPAAAQQTDTTAAPSATAADTSAQVKAAREAAQPWLAHMDATEYTKAWRKTANFFQKQVDAMQWTKTMQKLEKQIGEIEKRQFAQGEYTTSPPGGAPEGEYVQLVYASQASTVGDVRELVSLVREDSNWKVTGYVVRPAQQGQQ